jgi:carbamoyltransferase
MQDRQSGSYLGPAYGSREIEEFLQNGNLPFEVLGERDGLEKVASLIDAGNVVGWFDGRMEFGPRALGARSIIGDARSPKMQSIMNLKIKYRESFRPFAPIVLAEDLRDWFDVDGGREPDPHFSSPYMLMVGHVRDDLRTSGADPQASAELRRINQVRSKIPAVTHVDYSARIQTVHKETNSRLHALLAAFKQLTGCPVLVNTSFNVRGEPIVESPSDAYRCFMRTEIDYLVMGNYLLSKRQQPAFAEEKDWQTEFELD